MAKIYYFLNVSALYLLSELPSFTAVELDQKLVPEMHHFSHYEIRAEMWPKYITSLMFHLQLHLIQNI